jgi:hypothetical protein
MTGKVDLRDPKAVAEFIRESMSAALARALLTGPTPVKPVEGHEGHRLIELPTGGLCHRRVLCQTCEILLIETFEPASFVVLNVKTEVP